MVKYNYYNLSIKGEFIFMIYLIQSTKGFLHTLKTQNIRDQMAGSLLYLRMIHILMQSGGHTMRKAIKNRILG